MSGHRDIYSGVLHKCGGRIKTWTKRWMVLRSDYCLYYYKDATKNHLGVISLRDTQFKIRVGQKSDVSWPKNLALGNTFALVTTPRVYFMYADTPAEAEEWRKVLEDAHQDLLEVTRTKSFSGFRQKSLGVDPVFASQSLRAEGEGSLIGGGRPKAHTSATDSLASNASSVFGRQFTLSSSSDVGSPLAPVEEVESMYNVLQHPLVQEEKRAGPAEVTGGEWGEKGVNINEALYSQLPSSQVVGRRSLSSESEREYDYVLPPDAETPQNFSVTVAEDDRWKWAEPHQKGAVGKGSMTSSQTSLEAFYDFAHEAGSSSSHQRQEQSQEVSAVYDVIGLDNSSETPPTRSKASNGRQRTQQQQLMQEESAVYDVVGPVNSLETPPTQTPPTKSKTTGSTHKPMSAIAQPLPAIPPSFPPHPPLSAGREEQTIIYEDVPDIQKPKREEIVAVYDFLQNSKEPEKPVYEPVGVATAERVEEREEETMYSEVGFEERTPPLPKGSVGKYVNVPPGGETKGEVTGSGDKGEVTGSGDKGGGGYLNVSHSGETPPLPAREVPLSPSKPSLAPPTALPPSSDEETLPIVKPQPKPRSGSKPLELDQLPSNTNTVDQSPGNREMPPSPLQPNHTPSEKVPIPPQRKRDSTSDPFPRSSSSSSSSSISSYQRKFSPPPSPRSPSSPRTLPRPPSPLLSHRKATEAAADTSPHSSASGSPSNEGCQATSSRARTTSLKEKGIALFLRRQQEVASLSEQDSKRRKRSLSMLKGVQEDGNLSPDDKILFAETLREVESERMKASEERFRWERERMQLEEERKLLQQARERLQKELETTRKEIVQS